jgi:hypothetical protein
MKYLIKHIIKEETNKSVKLIRKYYDIEGDGANYRGDNVIHTLVTLYPKDYDNEMTYHNGSSICTWEFDDDHNLTLKNLSLPSSYFIPLMDYIGDTEDLEDYLESMHRTEAEKFILRIKHRRENPLS